MRVVEEAEEKRHDSVSDLLNVRGVDAKETEVGGDGAVSGAEAKDEVVGAEVALGGMRIKVGLISSCNGLHILKSIIAKVNLASQQASLPLEELIAEVNNETANELTEKVAPSMLSSSLINNFDLTFLKIQMP
ncbi:hypothetical protein E2542_SST28295 [Spatholobus suberectus]|nr:hypothetical protein E2542_SST28295 [Spatholobus suberectus]